MPLIPVPKFSDEPDQPVLQYKDISLYKVDVNTLDNDWITDNIIAFWEAYLETNLLTNPNYTSAQIHLLRPSISYSLTRRAEPASGMLPPLDGYSHVFVPINNNPDPTQVGGTHWSLLLVSLLDRMAFHYDSAHSSNWKQAQRATHNLSRYLKVDLELRDLPDSPQQRNYVDCGPFVCCEISYLLRERLLKHYKYDRVNMSLGRVSIDAHDMRKKLLQTIINERNGIQ